MVAHHDENDDDYDEVMVMVKGKLFMIMVRRKMKVIMMKMMMF